MSREIEDDLASRESGRMDSHLPRHPAAYAARLAMTLPTSLLLLAETGSILQFRNRAAKPVQRRCVSCLLIARLSALRLPTTTTSFLPRVIPV